MQFAATLLLRFGHSFLGCLKTDLGMCAVTEGFFGRYAAATKRHPFFHRELGTVGVDQLHFTGHDVGTILDCLDCYLSHSRNTKAPNPKHQAPDIKRQRRGNLGSTRVSRVGERVFAIANSKKIVSVGRQNQHASGVCSPETELARTILRRESCAS